MLRLECLILFFLWIVFVTSIEPDEVNAKPPLDAIANDLDADASYYYGYSRPWRYGWRSGWNGWGGWRGGWGWSGRGWSGRGGWW